MRQTGGVQGVSAFTGMATPFYLSCIVTSGFALGLFSKGCQIGNGHFWMCDDAGGLYSHLGHIDGSITDQISDTHVLDCILKRKKSQWHLKEPTPHRAD